MGDSPKKRFTMYKAVTTLTPSRWTDTYAKKT